MIDIDAAQAPATCPHCGTRWSTALIDYRPLLVPILVSFGLGLVVIPFSPTAGFIVWVGGTAIGGGVAFVRSFARERALRAQHPAAQLPEATLRRDRHDSPP